MISSPDDIALPETVPTRPVREVKEDSPFFKEFCEKMNTFPTPEEKIAHGLQFMKSAISQQEGSPRFREFWEVRRAVLPFFKENLNVAIRSKLWGDYVELTVEARRLKEILEEQSSFAMEQIDLALQAMEAEVEHFDTTMSQAQEVVISEESQTIHANEAIYKEAQRSLNVLNTWASRLSGLRKEVIRTDMRIRFKTKFFKRLSDLGDKVFPKRKELIETISAQFEKDVLDFVEKHFLPDQVGGAPYYQLREEIKALQGSAKLFTLSSGVFTRTRLKLSECWDQVKVLEKEYKKEMMEKRAASSEKLQAIQSKLNALREKAAELSFEALSKEIEEIHFDMRGASLMREDVQYIREEMAKIKAPHLEAQEQKLKAMEEAEKERLRVKREAVSAFKEKIAQLCSGGDAMEFDSLTNHFNALEEQLIRLELSKMERQQLERSMRPIKDLIAEKKELSILNLSEDDKKALENLYAVLGQKKQRRSEIKDQIEIYRKALGGSSLDFEKAMQYQELLEQERERLEKANSGIEEIESKISSLEG